MKKNVLLLFLIVFQIAFAESEAKQFEKFLNSIEVSKKTRNLNEIVNYINNKNIRKIDFLNNFETNKKNKKYVVFARGLIHYLNNEFEQASNIFYFLYRIVSEENNYNDQYEICHYLYYIEKILGNSSNSIYFLDKINIIYHKTKNINYLYFYLIEKGCTYRNVKQYDKAIILFEKAEKIANKIPNKSSFNWLFFHKGRTYLEMKEFNLAKKYYNLCKKNIDNTNYDILYILYEFFLIDYYKNDYEEALIKANQMIEIASKNSNIDNYMLVPLYNKMGEIYNYTNPEKAIYYFEKALTDGLKTKQHEGVYDACLQLLKNKDVSGKAQKNILLFLKNIEENENKAIITNLKSSERLKDILHFENELKDQKSDLLLNILFMISTFIVLTVLFVFFVIQKKNLSVIKDQKSELVKQNSILSKYNAELNLEYEKIEVLNNTLAHDVKSGIISINELANKIKINSVKTKIDLASCKIINETEVLKETIDFLLENAKANYDANIIAEEISWNEILERAKNSLDHLLLLINPSISLNVDLPYFKGYKTHFYQLFKNLIENSLKYNNPSKDCVITINISRSLKNGIKIVYEDNGLGIEQNSLNKIFEFFNQSKFEQISKGYGLGLGICKKIVDSYNGKITVESQINQGTRFTIIMYELND